MSNDTTFGRQGWICPKCGAVLSPDTTFCPFCTPVINNTIWTDNTSAGKPQKPICTTVSIVGAYGSDKQE